MKKKSSLEQKVIEVIEPALESMGLELVDLEIKRGVRGRAVRVFIDSPSGVDLDVCTDANNAISGILDLEDPIEGPYDLEVSSPGIEREITKVEHFKRYVGERVRVKTFEPVEGKRDFTGDLIGADDEGFEIEVAGSRYHIEYDNVSKANLKPEIGF